MTNSRLCSGTNESNPRKKGSFQVKFMYSLLQNFPVAISKTPFAIILFQPKWCNSPIEAVSQIKSDQNIFIHTGAATPTPLLNALKEHVIDKNLSNINTYHLWTAGDAPHEIKSFLQ